MAKKKKSFSEKMTEGIKRKDALLILISVTTSVAVSLNMQGKNVDLLKVMFSTVGVMLLVYVLAIAGIVLFEGLLQKNKK